MLMKHLPEVHAQATLSDIAVHNGDSRLGHAEPKNRDSGLEHVETKSKEPERPSYWQKMWGNEELQSWSYILSFGDSEPLWWE